MDNTIAKRRFAWFAWAVLVWNLAVIVWGAYVRVSFSGDGCGDRWPTCGGQLVPTEMAKPVIIEYTHRMMTSVDVIATIALCVFAFRLYPKAHVVRKYASLSAMFLVIEGLAGAGLVLFGYVGHDHSAGRAWYLSLHLTNTMLMLGAYTITAWLAQRDEADLELRGIPFAMRLAIVATFAVSITGAIAALGDTLFPTTTLAAGMRQDFSSSSPLLLRLRMLHPGIAVFSALTLLWASIQAMRGQHEDSVLRKSGARVIIAVFVQLAAGLANLLLSAPGWMQLLHLLIGDLVWIAVVLLLCDELLEGQKEVRSIVAATGPIAKQHAH